MDKEITSVCTRKNCLICSFREKEKFSSLAVLYYYRHSFPIRSKLQSIQHFILDNRSIKIDFCGNKGMNVKYSHIVKGQLQILSASSRININYPYQEYSHSYWRKPYASQLLHAQELPHLEIELYTRLFHFCCTIGRYRKLRHAQWQTFLCK